jgi:hypothetical protein
MFQNDQQLAAVCCAFLKLVNLESLWTENGPSERAKALFKADGGPLSSGERVMFLMAWALWNSRGKLSFVEMLEKLDSGNLTAVGEFLIAYAAGPESINSWLDGHRPA